MIKKITKILFLTVFSYLAVDANAQSQVRIDEPHYPALTTEDAVTTRVKANLFKKAEYSGWFFPTQAIEATGPQLTGYAEFLTADSTALIVNDNGTTRHNTWHLAGACFDPKDENYSFVTDGVNLSQFNKYKVDSVYFQYIYVRKLDSAIVQGVKVKVVDTLIFQFHNPNNMKFATFGTAPVQKYGIPKAFSRTIGGATNATYTEKIPLTDADSTRVAADGWGFKAMLVALPPGLTDAAAGNDNNQVAYNVFFKKMIPNKLHDTMEARNGATITNPVNYGGFHLYVNTNASSQVYQEAYRNNSYFIYKNQLYGGTFSGWTPFVQGNVFYEQRYMFCGFHLTTPNLKAADINKKGYGIGKISPNPSYSGQDVNVEFSIGNPERVTLTVSDILGKTLKTINTDKLNAGYNTISFNTASLTSGVYFYTITAGSFKASQKFTVTN